MKTVTVKFNDSKYNYTTSVNGSQTDEQIQRYFIGKHFNMGVFPEENFQCCVTVVINSIDK